MGGAQSSRGLTGPSTTTRSPESTWQYAQTALASQEMGELEPTADSSYPEDPPRDDPGHVAADCPVSTTSTGAGATVLKHRDLEMGRTSSPQVDAYDPSRRRCHVVLTLNRLALQGRTPTLTSPILPGLKYKQETFFSSRRRQFRLPPWKHLAVLYRMLQVEAGLTRKMDE